MRKLEELKARGLSAIDILELLEELVKDNDEKEIIGGREKDSELLDQINMNKKISKLLNDMGIPFHIIGTAYIRSAILYCLKCKKPVSVTKILYPAVAEEFETTPSRVERAIRHAIGKAFCNCTPVTEEIFRYTIDPSKGSPTNSEFIWTIVEYLRIS